MAASYQVVLDISCDNLKCECIEYADSTLWGKSKKECKERAVEFGWVFLKNGKTICGDCVNRFVENNDHISVDGRTR